MTTARSSWRKEKRLPLIGKGSLQGSQDTAQGRINGPNRSAYACPWIQANQDIFLRIGIDPDVGEKKGFQGFRELFRFERQRFFRQDSRLASGHLSWRSTAAHAAHPPHHGKHETKGGQGSQADLGGIDDRLDGYPLRGSHDRSHRAGKGPASPAAA